MTAPALLEALRSHGVSVTFAAGRILYRPKTNVPDALRQELSSRRAEIAGALGDEHPWGLAAAHEMVRATVDAVAAEYVGAFNAGAFHAFDVAAAQAIATQDMGQLARACSEYRQATKGAQR